MVSHLMEVQGMRRVRTSSKPVSQQIMGAQVPVSRMVQSCSMPGPTAILEGVAPT